MSQNWSHMLTAPLRRPIDGLKSLLGGLPLVELAGSLRSPKSLAKMAGLQLSFVGYRFVLPVLIGRELQYFSALEPAACSTDELAQRCGVPASAIVTLSRVLEAQGLVHLEDRRVGLTEAGRRYLTEGSKKSLVPIVDLLLTYTRGFSQIAEGLRTGSTPQILDVRRDGATTDALLEAVNTHLARASQELFERAELPPVRHFIAGSMGVSFSAELLRRQPRARVTYGCLDHLVERIPRLRRQYGVEADRVDGMHAHAGEPSEDRWGREAYDLVFLTRKMILEPEQKTGEKFARKAHQVLEPGGVAVFWEAIHPDGKQSPLPLALETVFDLGMSPSAPLKTRASFADTLRRIGFDRVDYVSCVGGSTTFAIAHKEFASEIT